MFYNHNQLSTFQRFLNVILGERGVGKTYHFTKCCIDEGLKTKKPSFVWLRRLIKDADNIKSKWWYDVEHEYPSYIFYNKGYEIYAKEKDKEESFVIGYIGSLSDFVRFKSVPFPFVKILVFDEFMAENNSRYLPNEVEKFVNLLDSVFRLRKGVVYMLGNSVSIASPYLEWLGVKGDIFHNRFIKGENYVIENCDYEEFRSVKRMSDVGKIIVGTKYGDYAIDNKFLLDDLTDVKPMTSNMKKEDMYNLRLNGRLICVSWSNGLIYFSVGKDSTYLTYTFYPKDAKDYGCLLLPKKSGHMREILDAFLQDRCLYDTLSVKNEIVKVIRMIYKNY